MFLLVLQLNRFMDLLKKYDLSFQLKIINMIITDNFRKFIQLRLNILLLFDLLYF